MNNKITLEYTNTAELQTKRDIAVREAKDNAKEAYNELHDKFKQLLNKSNVKFHIINLDQFGDTRIYNHITHEEFFKKYGPVTKDGFTFEPVDGRESDYQRMCETKKGSWVATLAL